MSVGVPGVHVVGEEDLRVVLLGQRPDAGDGAHARHRVDVEAGLRALARRRRRCRPRRRGTACCGRPAGRDQQRVVADGVPGRLDQVQPGRELLVAGDRAPAAPRGGPSCGRRSRSARTARSCAPGRSRGRAPAPGRRAAAGCRRRGRSAGATSPAWSRRRARTRTGRAAPGSSARASARAARTAARPSPARARSRCRRGRAPRRARPGPSRPGSGPACRSPGST